VTANGNCFNRDWLAVRKPYLIVEERCSGEALQERNPVPYLFGARAFSRRGERLGCWGQSSNCDVGRFPFALIDFHTVYQRLQEHPLCSNTPQAPAQPAKTLPRGPRAMYCIGARPRVNNSTDSHGNEKRRRLVRSPMALRLHSIYAIRIRTT
jgi:hypothetical protein